MLTLHIEHPAHAGARNDISETAKAAIKETTAIGPAASAADIPALSRLLEQTGWTPTPELSGVFRPGSIFAHMVDSHALLATDCISVAPQENTYTSAEIVSSMQAGVSVRAGLGSAEVSGGIIKKVKFSTPVHLSVPIIDLQLSAACFARLEALPKAQRDKAYVVREVLRAEIAEQTCGRMNAEGRMVGLGAADAELNAACMQASLEPVGVGYRTVPLNDLLAMGAAPEPEPEPEQVAAAVSGIAVPPATPASPTEPEAEGPFAVVFTESAGSCEWSIEDLPSGKSASLFASSECPSEMVWDGRDELYYQDGGAFYMLRAGKLRAEEVQRPSDDQCGSDPRQWLEPRLDRTTGGVRWACWVEADSTVPYTAPFMGDPKNGQIEMHKHCIDDVCAEGGSGQGIPIVIKDHAYDPETAWRHADSYADCTGTEYCWMSFDAWDAPLAPPDGPVNGMVTKTMVEEAHRRVATVGCDSMPEELEEDPSLEVLLRAGDHSTDDMGVRAYVGCPASKSGYLFWTRYWWEEGERGDGAAYGPVVLCDGACRRRKVIDLPAHGIDLQVAGTLAVAGPNSGGSLLLLDVAAQGVTREWKPNQKVLVLPEGTPTPLGIKP